MKNKVGILFYEVGNLKSVANALNKVGYEFQYINNVNEIKNFKKIILPGVGSFVEAKRAIKKKGFDDGLKEFIKKEENSLLGICLGMQLLLDKSLEFFETSGLSFIKGDVTKISNAQLCIPNIGWCEVETKKESLLLKNFKKKELCFYFAHSFFCNVSDKRNVIANLKIAQNVNAVIEKNNIYGCQFHPEKSQLAGLKFLKNFCSL